MESKNLFDIAALIGSGTCECGKPHPIITEITLVGSGAIAETGQVARELGFTGRALVVADANTWRIAGEQTVAALKAAGYEADTFAFKEEQIHTDEYAVGSIAMALKDDMGFLVAVGSGTVNDSCRFVAKRCNLPYLVVGTAPSMDGYASATSPILRGGFKSTWHGVAPSAIIGDADILKDAPSVMMAAGLGDVFGKFTALLDWQMAASATGEYHCEAVAGLMRRAVDACMAAAPGLAQRQAAAAEGLMKGLVLAGVAMQMVNDSRPASGSEHHVAHFLEMLDLHRGRGATLHGDKVGMSELIMLRFYEKFFEPDRLITRPMKPEADRVAEMRASLGAFGDMLLAQDCSAVYRDASVRQRAMEAVSANWGYWQAEAQKLPSIRLAGEDGIRRNGGPVRPAELGYSREDIVLALRYAMELRDKYTILRLAHHAGLLDGLAEEVADEFC